jgi:Fe-S cluster assembly iron-binding protein IscA
LVQDEPKNKDVVKVVGDMQFAVDNEYADIIDYFEIDYHTGFLRKGFSVYPNGFKGNC